MYDWIYYLLLLATLIIGLLVILPGLPGLWLMLAAVAGYAWLTGIGVFVGWPTLVALLVLALLAELVEFLAGSAGAAKAGGSKRGMAGALLGGIIGALLGSVLIPIPIAGTVVGACFGSFIGATGVELTIGRAMHESFRIGVGAAKGRFWGIVSKLAFGLIMLIVAAIAALPL